MKLLAVFSAVALVGASSLVGCAAPTEVETGTADQDYSAYNSAITTACMTELDAATRWDRVENAGEALTMDQALSYANSDDLGLIGFRIVRTFCSSDGYNTAIHCSSKDVVVDADTHSMPAEEWSYRMAKVALEERSGTAKLRIQQTMPDNSAYQSRYTVTGSFDALHVDMKVFIGNPNYFNLRRDLSEVKDDDNRIVLDGRLGKNGLYLEKTRLPVQNLNTASCARIVGSTALPSRVAVSD